MKLRPAEKRDMLHLFHWRNDPFTREMSINQDVVSANEHQQWFNYHMDDILIAEVNGVKVGVCRVDTIDELSWTIAPDYRGQGHGTEMVGKIVQKIGHPIALIKHENRPSIRIARKAGLMYKSLMVYKEG